MQKIRELSMQRDTKNIDPRDKNKKKLYFCARLLHSRIIIETKSCEQRVFV